MKALAAAAAITMCLGGCAGSPASIAMMNDEGLQKEALGNLCNAYGMNRSERVWAELLRRQAITSANQSAVQAKNIRIGMTTCEMLASWGPPSDVNRTVRPGGVLIQHVYRPCDHCKGQYVYTDGSVVTSFQD